VRLRTNKPISVHYLSGGATGRLHIHLADFDLDGEWPHTLEDFDLDGEWPHTFRRLRP
jgi:Ser/Thr protein kinase RdoA (MazF antagonist)